MDELLRVMDILEYPWVDGNKVSAGLKECGAHHVEVHG